LAGLYAPLVHVAIEVGERLGELLGSNWSDLELETGVWNLERQLTKHGELTSPKTKHGIRGTAARLAPRAHARGVTLQDLSMVIGHSSTPAPREGRFSLH
jgi:integrase